MYHQQNLFCVVDIHGRLQRALSKTKIFQHPSDFRLPDLRSITRAVQRFAEKTDFVTPMLRVRIG